MAPLRVRIRFRSCILKRPIKTFNLKTWLCLEVGPLLTLLWEDLRLGVDETHFTN